MSGMKIGGGANGALGGGLDNIGSKFTDVGKKVDGDSNNSGKTNSGNGSSGALNFGSSALGKIIDHGVQFGSQGGNKPSQVSDASSGSEGGQGVGGENSTMNSITQLLNAIVQLLKGQQGGEEGSKTGTDAGNGSGTGSGGTQEAGSGDILTQLMDMIKKMLGQQSSDGSEGSSDAASQSGSGSSSPAAAQSSNGSQEAGQDGSGMAGKLGSALQMLGLGALLSALQNGGGTGAQGGSEGTSTK